MLHDAAAGDWLKMSQACYSKNANAISSHFTVTSLRKIGIKPREKFSANKALPMTIASKYMYEQTLTNNSPFPHKQERMSVLMKPRTFQVRGGYAETNCLQNIFDTISLMCCRACGCEKTGMSIVTGM